MKKFTGRYTPDAAKALKGSNRLICRVSEDGTIYVSNGYVLFSMTAAEYAAVVQPVACCDAGNWSINKDGQRSESDFDCHKVFSDSVKAVSGAAPLSRCPLSLDDKNASIASFYNPAAGFASFYNKRFVAAFQPGATLRAPGAVSPAVAFADDEPFALILPIKPAPDAARAVKAYFTEANNAPAPKTDEADALRRELSQAQNEAASLRDELSQAQNEIVALREQIARQAAELDELRQTQQATQPAAPQTALEPKTAAEEIASRWSQLDGLTATIKGAQTAAPVVWLSGDTQKHAQAIEAGGGKWSAKRAAYYFRVA